MLVVGALATAPVAASDDDDGTARRPNIVVIMTDDQNVESLEVMDNVNRLIGKQGTTFEESVVSFPICCPSRATYLTGQYATNHGVIGNVAPWGGFGAFTGQDTTFPVALQAAGYQTVHIGKYLNGYGVGPDPAVPPGWSEWYGGIDPSTYEYFGFTLLENGTEKTYPERDDRYQTDVYTDLAVSAIRRHAENDEQPFFLDVAYLAPHVNAREGAGATSKGLAVPAPRHAGALSDERLPKPPSFNERDVSDKPAYVQALPRWSKQQKADTTDHYRAYLESLLAVDEGVERIIRALRRAGVLDDTLIVFTSDNGYFFGEHRFAPGKGRFYEPAIRVPLLMRGPGVARDETEGALVANTDLAPTILELAGAAPLREMDGRPLLLAPDTEPASGNRAVLLQSGGPYRPDWGIRTSRYTYIENSSGERELYDLRKDPDQLRNLAGTPAADEVEADLVARLAALKTCAGSSCN